MSVVSPNHPVVLSRALQTLQPATLTSLVNDVRVVLSDSAIIPETSFQSVVQTLKSVME